ncbi:hypothetical protein [Neoroseomonas eburnea]|uniref:hypothetical protein n=1 Tax=Neoroseomonas eburnea TaxID=1346889 RepID=UPI001BAA1FB1|nr:hypothetical protein [Neoroseomonas eburnea]
MPLPPDHAKPRSSAAPFSLKRPGGGGHLPINRYRSGYAIRQKAEIMVDHFHDQVVARQKIGGNARAMVVTGGIQRAIQYFHAFRDSLRERKSPCQAIVAFSGEHEYGGQKVTEASLNGFPSSAIEERIQKGPHRFLICADKFQTGYDEPPLHTMYVDKALLTCRAWSVFRPPYSRRQR